MPFNRHLATAVLRVSAPPRWIFSLPYIGHYLGFGPDYQAARWPPWDLGVWASGGFSVPGGTKDTKAVDAGVRLGKVLTGRSLRRALFAVISNTRPT